MYRAAATPAPSVAGRTTGDLTISNRLDHMLARWRINRSGHRVEPGLYALGTPGAESPVFVSANYTLSFDALRVALKGFDCYILALDTKGINVWCAAGKGTFGTDEIVERIRSTGVAGLVKHRRLIVPQLGAPGVAAHEVKRRSGFKVVYGPVRADDLPEYLKSGQATDEMRRVRFTLADRLTLIPVELVGVLLPTAAAVLVLFLVGGVLPAAAAAAAALAGVVAFPALLPWIPTPDFTTKGFLLGALAAVPLALAQVAAAAGPPWARYASGIPYMLMVPAVTAFLALNFTGSSTFTSRSGVKREIYSYVPAIAWTFGGGAAIAVALAVFYAFGGRQ